MGWIDVRGRVDIQPDFLAGDARSVRGAGRGADFHAAQRNRAQGERGHRRNQKETTHPTGRPAAAQPRDTLRCAQMDVTVRKGPDLLQKLGRVHVDQAGGARLFSAQEHGGKGLLWLPRG